MAPGSNGGSSFFSKAAVVAARISAFDLPASASLVFIRKMGRKLRAAAGLKQMGDRIFGFQNSGKSVAAPQPRSTTHTKPFLPCVLFMNPDRPRTITSASPEMEAGAPLRA